MVALLGSMGIFRSLLICSSSYQPTNQPSDRSTDRPTDWLIATDLIRSETRRLLISIWNVSQAVQHLVEDINNNYSSRQSLHAADQLLATHVTHAESLLACHDSHSLIQHSKRITKAMQIVLCHSRVRYAEPCGAARGKRLQPPAPVAISATLQLDLLDRLE